MGKDSEQAEEVMRSNKREPPLRERLMRSWRDNKWFVVAALWILAVVLGYVGWSRYFSSMGESHSVWFVFYQSLSLFVFESGGVPGTIPWTLEVARLLAPAVTVFTAITVIVAVFYEQLQRVRLRFIKDHVVVCGLGRKGMVFAKKFRGQHTLVMIEQCEDNPMLEQCKSQGAIVLIGNAADPVMLEKAKIHKARYLISVCGDDGVNAEVAVHARELVGRHKGSTLTCLVHIVDLQLCNLVREQEMYMGKADNFRLNFFNVFESGARKLLNQYPAFTETGEDDEQERPHPLVVGLGRMGESVIVHAAERWRQSDTSRGRLRISLLGRDAEKRRESLRLQHPKLDKSWELIPLQMDIDSPEYQRADFLFGSMGKVDVTIVYVCLDGDSRALSAALLLLKSLPDRQVPIVVRMSGDAGLSSLLRGEMGDYAFANLYAFGLLDKTCRPDLLFTGVHEQLAQAIHEEYLSYRTRMGQPSEINPAMVSWDDLPDKLKESNRRQAGHITEKLKLVGCAIVPIDDVEAEPFEFNAHEVELLAEMEHERWMEERVESGWKCGPKDVEKKTSPFLVSWEELSEDEKEYDRDTVRNIPIFLSGAGFKICRLNASDDRIPRPPEQ